MANPTPVGTPTLIEGTTNSVNANHTVNASAEISIVDVIAYRSAGSIARPTVTMAGETVTYAAERFAQFSVANDQYAGRFYVDSPTSGSKSTTVAFSSVTAQANVAYDFQTVGTSSAPFDDNQGAEGSNNNPTDTTTTTTDDTVVSTAGFYNLTRSSINDGGTNISYDNNGASYISRSTHYITGGSASTTSSITLSGSGEWLILNSTIGGTGGGGGGAFIPIIGRGPGMALAGRGGLAG